MLAVSLAGLSLQPHRTGILPQISVSAKGQIASTHESFCQTLEHGSRITDKEFRIERKNSQEGTHKLPVTQEAQKMGWLVHEGGSLLRGFMSPRNTCRGESASTHTS